MRQEKINQEKSLITKTGKEYLEENGFPSCSDGNSTKETKSNDNENDGMSQDFQDNKRHLIIKKTSE